MSRLVLNLRDTRPLWQLPDWGVERIRETAGNRFEVVVIQAATDGRGDGGGPSPEAVAAMPGAEVHIGFGFPRPLFTAAQQGGGNLRWVHSASAGIGGALYPEMRHSDILLTNSAGIHGDPIAETIVGVIHYFARGLDFVVHAQRERRWHKAPFEGTDSPVHEVAGETLGILGYGGIGQALASRASALGMRVLAHRRRPVESSGGAEVLTGESGLERIIRESRYLVLALPRTPETEGILSAERIGALRRDAVVINVGRGELIDEDALADAARAGRIRGAGLDVFRTEPLPESSPLWEIPNILVIPHVSPTSRRFWDRQIELIVQNLRRYMAGEPLLNLVDKQAGY